MPFIVPFLPAIANVGAIVLGASAATTAWLTIGSALAVGLYDVNDGAEA